MLMIAEDHPLMLKHAKGELKARPPIPPHGGLRIGSLRSTLTSRSERAISR